MKNIVLNHFKEETLNNKLEAINTNAKGKYNISKISFNENIFVYKSHSLLQESIQRSSLHAIDGIAFEIGIKGATYSKSLIFGHEFFSQESYMNIHLISQDNISHEIPKNTDNKALHFVLKKSFLEKVLPNSLFKDDVLKSLQNHYFNKTLAHIKMNSKIHYLANELFFSSLTGEMNQLYFESKTLEIIYHCLHIFCNNKDTCKFHSDVSNGIKFTKYDIDALNKAKIILLENLQSPPNIATLSKIVKLNDFKLQIGFKKLFNLTPYACLLEERMQQAKILLETSELNINEISIMVGYTYAQNFSNAFFKRFGIRPKELMKNRKYYY